MSRLAKARRSRLLPAALTAAGVALLAIGLLAAGHPAGAGAPPPSGEPSPSDVALASDPPPIDWTLPSFPPPGETPPPSASPSGVPADRVVTRVVVAELGIDLPVIVQPDPSYPSCNVAMYLVDSRLGVPGSNKSIYLYAHARTGMFLPLLAEVRRDGGSGLIGMLVDVYTSDDQHFVYRITAVLPRVPSDSHFLDKVVVVKREALWLQTSTGPGGQYPKLQVVARPVGVEPAPHDVANPTPHPVDCH